LEMTNLPRPVRAAWRALDAGSRPCASRSSAPRSRSRSGAKKLQGGRGVRGGRRGGVRGGQGRRACAGGGGGALRGSDAPDTSRNKRASRGGRRVQVAPGRVPVAPACVVLVHAGLEVEVLGVGVAAVQGEVHDAHDVLDLVRVHVLRRVARAAAHLRAPAAGGEKGACVKMRFIGGGG
jgi:hypothetical protein